MTRRAQLWRIVAAVFTIINAVGAGMAASEGEQLLAQLQQSVDAIAIEVERIGEAQRFSARLQSDKVEKKP